MAIPVGISGSGPAFEAINAAFGDVATTAERAAIDDLPAYELAVVIDRTGEDAFARANDTLDGPWVAVELGGVGGRAVADVSASIAGFTPDSGCYACLETRIAAGDPDTAAPEVDARTARLAGALAGHELLGALDGEETPLFGGAIELPYTPRRVLPVPGCCDELMPTPQRHDHEERPLQDAIARAEAAVDERVGIVRDIGEVASFPAPYYLATISETDGFSDASAANKAAGVAADWNDAYMKALGEALERYSASVYRTADFAYARPADRADAIAPEAFTSVTDGTDAEIPWVEGERLDTGDSVALPAEFVHFPPPETRFGTTITTGLGLGNSPVEALLSGSYEIIERDAAMLAWYSTFEPIELAVEDDTFGTLERRAAGEGLSVTPLLITQDIDVPVVAVAVHRENEWPKFAVGSDADLDPAAAARSALCEALQNWTELRSLGPDAAREQAGWIGRHASFPDPARAFLTVDGQVDAGAVGPDDPPTGAAELDAVIELARAAGLTPYAAWLTTRDVRELGFEAARALMPTAQPLFTDEPVFGERAEAVPPRLGFEPRLDRDPHPFP